MWQVTRDMWQVTGDTWHVTHDMWHVTCDTWHVTCLGRWTFSQNFSSLALTVCDLWYYEDLEEKDHWLNYLNNYEAVYRTAPATPGLLIMTKFRSQPHFLWHMFSVDHYLLIYHPSGRYQWQISFKCYPLNGKILGEFWFVSAWTMKPSLSWYWNHSNVLNIFPWYFLSSSMYAIMGRDVNSHYSQTLLCLLVIDW